MNRSRVSTWLQPTFLAFLVLFLIAVFLLGMLANLSNPECTMWLTPAHLSTRAWIEFLRSQLDSTDSKVNTQSSDWLSAGSGVLTFLERAFAPETSTSYLRTTFVSMLLSVYLYHHTRPSEFACEVFDDVQAKQLASVINYYEKGGLERGDIPRMLLVFRCSIAHFYTHALYRLAPDSTPQSLTISLQELAPLHVILGSHLEFTRRSGPEVTTRLKRWIPRQEPNIIAALSDQTQLTTFLLVIAFLLDSRDEGVCDAFKARECLQALQLVFTAQRDSSSSTERRESVDSNLPTTSLPSITGENDSTQKEAH